MSNVPVKIEGKSLGAPAVEQTPFEALHRQINHLFDTFGHAWPAPFGSASLSFEPAWLSNVAAMPAVDIVENEKAYEITADLPGIDEKNIDVQLNNGNLTIRGEKKEEKEEKKKDYFLHERYIGSFERSFAVPETVDGEKIAATFNKGVLTITLPKKPEAQKAAKKIEVKAA